jgi:hypothetical protein
MQVVDLEEPLNAAFSNATSVIRRVFASSGLSSRE